MAIRLRTRELEIINIYNYCEDQASSITSNLTLTRYLAALPSLNITSTNCEQQNNCGYSSQCYMIA